MLQNKIHPYHFGLGGFFVFRLNLMTLAMVRFPIFYYSANLVAFTVSA